MSPGTAKRIKKPQSPKGTRDFYPADLAVRRHIEGVWRRVSEQHGFDEVDGPTFEHLDLYTLKSGDGIVSELFSFRRAGGDTDYALRPEFTPTLARMYAAAARTLPQPTRWYSIPSHFRAERPQRGRLREFFQWNVDVIGDDSARADAEVIAVTVAAFRRFGFTPDQVRVKINHRDTVDELLDLCAVSAEQRPAAYRLLDAMGKLSEADFEEQAVAIGIDASYVPPLRRLLATTVDVGSGAQSVIFTADGQQRSFELDVKERFGSLRDALAAHGVLDWCEIDYSIVRGIAYYTGLVFEVHEVTGTERALAGGGRYDSLIELLGGPSTPAVGMAMGDVVLRLVLEDRGLLTEPAEYLPRPDVFVLATTKELSEAVDQTVAILRGRDLHVRRSDRATQKIGKLLGDAGKARARLAVILDAEYASGRVTVKDLASGEQQEVDRDELPSTVHTLLASA